MIKPSHLLLALRRSLTARILAGVVTVYFLFSYLAINPLAQWLLPWVAEHQLASRASVGHVSFDPLRLRLTIRQFKLTTAQDELLASFDALDADLNSNGLWQWAWKLDHISLQQPQVKLHISPQGIFNWAALLAKLNEDQTPPSDSLPRVVIEQLAITQGKLDYQNLQHGNTAALALTPLNFSLSGFSTLPKDRGDYLLAATLPDQGGTLKWKGNISVNPLASSGKLAITQLDLPTLLKLLPPSALQLTQGRLQGQFDYALVLADNKPVLSLAQLALAVEQLQGTHATAGQFALERVGVRTPQLHLHMQPALQIDLQDISLDSHPLQLSKSGSSIQLAAITATLPTLSLREQQAFMPDLKDLNIQLNTLRLLHQNNALLTLPALNLHAIDLDSTNHHLHIGQLALLQGQLSATRLASGITDWQQAMAAFADPGAADAEVVAHAPQPDTTASMQISIGDIRLDQWQLAYQDHTFRQPLAVTVSQVNASLALQHDAQQSALQHLTVDLTRIAASSGGTPAATLAQVNLKDGNIALDKQQIQVAALTLSGLQSSLIRHPDGSSNWQQILTPGNPAAPATQAVAMTRPAAKQAPGWQLTLKKLVLQQSGLHIEDQSSTQPVILDLQQLQAEVGHPSLDLKQALPVKASLAIKQGGRFELSGTVSPAPLHASLQLSLREAALKPFSPLLNQQATLLLDQGDLSLSGKLSVATPEQIRFEGGFNLHQLSIVEDTAERNPFLQWESLASDTVTLTTAPKQLSITSLTLSKPQGKFIIHPDRSLNVTQVLHQPKVAEVSATASTAPAATTTADNSTTASSNFLVNIDSLRIQQANVTFADLSLTPQFGTDIHDLSGVINGIASRSDAIAQVELDGKVDDYGAARVRGRLQPFQATQLMDLRLVFNNLEMRRLTPYSGKFAGRKIESGKLSVDLQYQIKQRQLAAENQFIIQKLKLGQQVDSKDAADLPLDLAIAILEDRDGVIDLNLPVKGSLDDPQFSYSAIAWKAFRNILTKIVTAPFALLGKLFGGESENLDGILFEAGSAIVSPPELEKLHQLASGLNQRPQLQLTIRASYDEAADRRALQALALREQVAAALKQPTGPIDTSNPKVQAVLQSLHDRLTKKPLLKRLVSKLEKPTSGHFEEIQQVLTDSIDISDSTLVSLATQRADAITQALLAQQVAADRIHTGKVERQQGGGESIKTALSLAAPH